MKKSLLIFIGIFCALSAWSQANWTWTKVASLPNCKRDNAAGFSAAGMGFMCCGMDTNNMVEKDVWQYDPHSDVWTQKADLPGVARRNPFSFSINNIGYVGSGIADSSVYGTILNDVYAYDPTSNSWTSKAPYPIQIYRAPGAACNGKGYVFGGRSSFMSMYDVYEYDPATDSWAAKTPMPPAPGSSGGRDGGSAFAVGTKFYFGLGRDDSFYDFHFWEFDPATNLWTLKADFPGGHRTDAIAFTIGNLGFVGLGTDGGYKKDFWAYNPASDTWSFANNFNGAARRDVAAFVINDTAYVTTGKSVNGTKQDCYKMYNAPVGIAATTPSELSFRIYPQPANEEAYLELNHLPFDATLQVYTIEGRIIYKQPVRNTVTPISLLDHSSGVFLFTITNDYQVLATGKFIH